MTRDKSPRARDIASRTLAAALGGYAATYALTGAMGVLLPLTPAETVYLGAMLAFPVYTFFVLWAFAVRSQRLAWGVPVVIAAAAAIPLMWRGIAA